MDKLEKYSPSWAINKSEHFLWGGSRDSLQSCHRFSSAPLTRAEEKHRTAWGAHGVPHHVTSVQGFGQYLHQLYKTLAIRPATSWPRLQSKCYIQSADHRSESSNTMTARSGASLWPLPSPLQHTAWVKPSSLPRAKKEGKQKALGINCQRNKWCPLHSPLPVFLPCACPRVQVLLSFLDSYICQTCHIFHPFLLGAKAKADTTDACWISAICWYFTKDRERKNGREKDKGGTVAVFNEINGLEVPCSALMASIRLFQQSKPGPFQADGVSKSLQHYVSQ